MSMLETIVTGFDFGCGAMVGALFGTVAYGLLFKGKKKEGHDNDNAIAELKRRNELTLLQIREMERIADCMLEITTKFKANA